MEPAREPPILPECGNGAPIGMPADGQITVEWAWQLRAVLERACFAPPASLVEFVPKGVFESIIKLASSAVSSDGTLCEIKPSDGVSVKVVGDTHGQFQDLCRLFDEVGVPSETSTFIFNGDFVDRGAWGVETVSLLFALKVALPKNVFLLRGNHETTYSTTTYGFREELRAKFKGPSVASSLYRKFLRAFTQLPLGAHFGRTFVFHGGLFQKDKEVEERRSKRPRPDAAGQRTAQPPATADRAPHKLSPDASSSAAAAAAAAGSVVAESTPVALPPPLQQCTRPKAHEIPFSELGSLEDLRKSQRAGEDPTSGLASDILWSDPGKEDGVRFNSGRGIGLVFGPDATDYFLRTNGLRLIIRSHEGPDARAKRPDMNSMDSGWSVDHASEHGCLATLFSAPCYPQFCPRGTTRVGNQAAVCVLQGPHFDEPVISRFTAAPRPQAVPYYDPDDAPGSDEEGPDTSGKLPSQSASGAGQSNNNSDMSTGAQSADTATDTADQSTSVIPGPPTKSADCAVLTDTPTTASAAE